MSWHINILIILNLTCKSINSYSERLKLFKRLNNCYWKANCQERTSQLLWAPLPAKQGNSLNTILTHHKAIGRAMECPNKEISRGASLLAVTGERERGRERERERERGRERERNENKKYRSFILSSIQVKINLYVFQVSPPWVACAVNHSPFKVIFTVLLLFLSFGAINKKERKQWRS